MAAAAADAGGPATAVRIRLAWRVVRAAELLALAVLLSRSFPHLPSAAAAASSVVLLAASLLLHPLSIFILANAIVLVLALSRRDISSSPSDSSSSDHDAQDQLLSFAAPPLLLPPVAEAPGPAPEEDAVFEDKQAVHVTVRAPRRSRSEKIGGGSARRRAASPELRRSESENGQRQRLTSSLVGIAGGVGCGRVEDEEFRRAVEAFIAKQQTRFHREESLVLVASAGDEAPVIAGAVAAVK